MDISLKYTITYTECDLAPKAIERKPVLCLYYDNHFVRTEADGGIALVHMDEDSRTKTYSGTLTAKSNYRVPMTARIGMACYAMRHNSDGMSVYTNAGTSDIKISDILAATSKGTSYDREHTLVMETTRIFGGEPMEKGKVRVQISELKLGKRMQFVPLQHCLLGNSLSTSLAGAERELEGLLKRRIDFESRMVDTWEGIKKVRAPMDISSAGIELLKTAFVPVEGFAMTGPLESNVGYFQNAFERVMIRQGLENPKEDFANLPRPRQAEILGEILCYASQNFDYVSDTVERSKRTDGKPYNILTQLAFEDFNLAGTTLSGDCEDTASLIRMMKETFAGLKIDANANPALVALQNIEKHYTFFLVLATVHGAKAEDQTEHIGAHMFGVMLPSHQVRAALKTNDYGLELLSKFELTPDKESIGLPTLFCEGTGRIRPMGPGPIVKVNGGEFVRSTLAPSLAATRIGAEVRQTRHISYDPKIFERMMLTRIKSKAGAKMEIPHDYGGDSSFYLGVISGVTMKCMEKGLPHGNFIFGYANPETRSITRGAKFVDIINQEETVALIPCEPMSPRVLELTKEAVAIRAPCRPFIFTGGRHGSSAPSEKNAHLDFLSTSIERLGRKGNAPYGSVDIFMRPHQFNQKRVQLMARELSGIDAVYKVSYEREFITDTVITYRIRVFMDHAKVMSHVNM